VRASPVQEEQQSRERDRDLVRAVRAGDADAFDVLFQDHHPALVRLLTARLGDPVAAEDVAQDVMIRALAGLERFDLDRPLWPWLRQIALNAAVDVVRARGRAAALTAALTALPEPPPQVGPAEHVIAERDVLRRAMQDIPERQRRALERCYVEGWRPTDVAEQFGVGSNAFEQLLHRARGNLRRAYARHDGDRAAGVAWLLLWSGWAQQVVGRGRRVAVEAVGGAGQAVAAGLVAATIAVGAAGPPAPSAGPPPAVVQAEVQGEVQDEPRQAAPVGAAEPAPGAAAAPPAGPAPDAERAAAGAAAAPRPAPVAAAPPPPPADPPLPLPGADGGDVGSRPAPDAAAPAPPPESVPDAVGGCGSVVRQAVCDTADPMATGLGLGG
jgi:RNA polymerase sigma factor (sigma-70 family)